MSLVHARSTFDATSAAGAMHQRSGHEPRLVGVMLVESGTSMAPERPSRALRLVQQSTTGTAIVERPGSAIAELRRLSGLTWEQLAQLFQVTRRSLHFWASGKAMTPDNQAHLYRLLDTIRQIDRGFSRANRALLIAAHGTGNTAFEMLIKGEYDRVIALIGPGNARPRVRSPRLAKEARAARAPRPPEELVGALQDRVHLEKPGKVTAKPIRFSREK